MPRLLTRFVAAIEPWYDWGRRDVARMDAQCRAFTDESYGEVRFFEVQWLGLHFEVQLGRTPPKASAEDVAAAKASLAERASCAS